MSLLACRRAVYLGHYYLISLSTIYHIQYHPVVSCSQTMYYCIVRFNAPVDKQELQLDLDRLNYWCDTNAMVFNAGKTKVMHITRSRRINSLVYNLGTTQIDITNSYQYLGLTIDAKLSWGTHTTSIVARANCILAFIRAVCQGFLTECHFHIVYM